MCMLAGDFAVALHHLYGSIFYNIPWSVVLLPPLYQRDQLANHFLLYSTYLLTLLKEENYINNVVARWGIQGHVPFKYV
jgi:hypothetical protein